jgi:hypothetical protein
MEYSEKPLQALVENDAEFGGIGLGTFLRLKQGTATPGSPEWAANKLFWRGTIL